MKVKSSIILTLSFLTLLISSVNAGWFGTNSLDHSYFITSNYRDEDAPPGATVVITAATTDSRVKAVRFLWFAPDGTLARISKRIPVWNNGSEWTNTTGSYPIYFAEDKHKPNVPGRWGVVAVFLDDREIILCRFSIVIAVRFTFFNVVPEIEIFGTVGAASAMLLGFGFFIMKRRRLPSM